MPSPTPKLVVVVITQAAANPCYRVAAQPDGQLLPCPSLSPHPLLPLPSLYILAHKRCGWYVDKARHLWHPKVAHLTPTTPVLRVLDPTEASKHRKEGIDGFYGQCSITRGFFVLTSSMFVGVWVFMQLAVPTPFDFLQTPITPCSLNGRLTSFCLLHVCTFVCF